MITAQSIVDLLNELVVIDPAALHDLVETRVLCHNPTGIENHRTVIPSDEDGPLKLGLLGVLNGIAGLDDERIEAGFDDVTKRLVKFRLRAKPTNGVAK